MAKEVETKVTKKRLSHKLFAKQLEADLEITSEGFSLDYEVTHKDKDGVTYEGVVGNRNADGGDKIEYAIFINYDKNIILCQTKSRSKKFAAIVEAHYGGKGYELVIKNQAPAI